jgi:hypothetical protein
MKKLSVLLFCIVMFSGFTFSQEQYGNIRGVAVDENGEPLPGVTVTLESELYNPRSQVTSEGGIFRFLNVSVGPCRVKCELPGFKTYIQENIEMTVGFNVDLKVKMEIATLEEEVVVVSQSPVVDMKKTGTSTTFTQEMLQEIPSARDPWVILQQTPGILTVRENVGGSESGQQYAYLSRGGIGMSWNNMWNMDGVPITDMISTGSSAMYYDFDTFEEIQITTSGQDATMQAGGVSVNLVTRRGTNKFQVIGRAYFTNDRLQGDNRTQELIDLDYVGNQINQIMDYGLQVGGPIKRDKIWFWLGYGVQDIRKLTINGYPDEPKLYSLNSKLNFNISRNNRAELAFIYNKKSYLGRDGGPSRPPETTWDQRGNHPTFKLEDEHIFSDNFLINLRLAYHEGWFDMTPRGGMDTQAGYDYYTRMASGSADYYKSERPSFVAKLESIYFVEGFLGGDHEFRFGFTFRSTPSWGTSVYPGDTFKYYYNGSPLYAEVIRESIMDFWGKRYSLYFNDTFTTGRWTFNLGLRADKEDADNNDATVRASEVGPELLPAFTYPGVDPGVSFLFVSPRLGFTFDLTGDGKTILRGNAAIYGSQQGPWAAQWISSSSLAYAGYFWTDANGDDRVTSDELVGYPLDGILYFDGFDPWDPTNVEGPYAIDPDLKTELIDEIILGMEREIFTDFSVSANFIYRRNHRFMWTPYYDKETGWIEQQSDWVGPYYGSATQDGVTYDYEYWALNRYRPGGNYMTNQPDYHQIYRGIDIVATKRFNHRWMLNASFTYQLHTVHYGERGYLDPTNLKTLDGARYWGSDWMVKVSFLYQLPWGFNFSCFANARQGAIRNRVIYVPTPERGTAGLGTRMNINLERMGTSRLPNFYNVDLSLTKDFDFERYGRLTLQVDAFNVFNFDHTLGRYDIMNSGRADEITRILNPRVIRFGIRYRF